jgi:type 1 glutamine amidotransferase
MLVYSKTAEFRHLSAIEAGKVLLQEIADEVGFELVATEENAFLAELASFEAVFFLNTTGDVFTRQEEQIFEAWMTAGGAFIGTHSATATEFGWPFYTEVIGQFYEGHGPQGVTTDLLLDENELSHPALQGLPNPWQRTDEWHRFNAFMTWSAKPGFRILARNSADGHPVSWQREWGGFRSFLTSLGHDSSAFDPLLKKHLTGAIMWAVRREHLLP